MNIFSFKSNWLLSLIISLSFACNKPNDPSPTPAPPKPSSDKSITSFDFKVAFNSSLPANIIGVIGQDTIKLSLPFGTPLNNLVPTLTFNGKSINPENYIGQDFNSPVAYTVTAEDGTTKKYFAMAIVQPLAATIFWNTSNGSASLSPSNLGYVYALDANTGNLRWKYTPSGYSFNATPAFSNGILYTSNYRKIIALDTASKAVKWEYSLTNTVYAAIAVVNEIVYFNCNDGNLYALDAKVGTLKWKFAQDNDFPLNTDPSACSSSPTIVNGTVYFGNSRSKYVYALDANTGSLKWKTLNTLYLNGAFQSGPSVVNDIVYIADLSHNVIALDARNGSVKWSFGGDSGFGSSPTVVNGTVYMTGRNYLFALDAVTGTLKWKFGGAYMTDVSPAVVNGVAYFGGGGGSGSVLYAVDAVTGVEKWRFPYTGLTDVASPVVYKDLVYFPIDYDFIALDINTGKLKWKFTSIDGHEQGGGSPLVVDVKGTVYYSSISGLQN